MLKRMRENVKGHREHDLRIWMRCEAKTSRAASRSDFSPETSVPRDSEESSRSGSETLQGRMTDSKSCTSLVQRASGEFKTQADRQMRRS
jgi:hypothetical protein